MLELKIEIRDAEPAYVNEKVGPALYVHLRAVPQNVELRRRAIDRAHRRYTEAEERSEPEALLGGLGLLVLQRAMLAVEDIGGLLYALEDPPDFGRLVSYELDDISALFDRLFSGAPTVVPELYRIGTREAIDAEPDLADEHRAALKRLRAITLAHLRQQLAALRHFWLTFHHEAKKTMHGVGFIAGCHALEPPGAGMVSALLDPGQPRPFAIPLTTRIDRASQSVNTEVGAVDLSPSAVDQIRDAGLAACEAMELLVAGRLHGLETNHAYTLPATYLDELNAGEGAVLAPLFGQ